MCFGRSSKVLDPPLPARIPPSNSPSGNDKSQIPTTAKRDSATSRPKDDHQYGESLSLSMHAKHRKIIREAYPDGNVPDELRKFKETGICQGALGGPVGGGAGMALSGGF